MTQETDINNPVIKLCIEGTQAEFASRIDEARRLYQEAWAAANDDYEMCVAAHYVARHQENPEDQLHWNREALIRADAVGDKRILNFYPSLYLNMGHAYEKLGNLVEARHYYELAAELGVVHQSENHPHQTAQNLTGAINDKPGSLE